MFFFFCFVCFVVCGWFWFLSSPLLSSPLFRLRVASAPSHFRKHHLTPPPKGSRADAPRLLLFIEANVRGKRSSPLPPGVSFQGAKSNATRWMCACRPLKSKRVAFKSRLICLLTHPKKQSKCDCEQYGATLTQATRYYETPPLGEDETRIHMSKSTSARLDDKWPTNQTNHSNHHGHTKPNRNTTHTSHHKDKDNTHESPHTIHHTPYIRVHVPCCYLRLEVRPGREGRWEWKRNGDARHRGHRGRERRLATPKGPASLGSTPSEKCLRERERRP